MSRKRNSRSGQLVQLQPIVTIGLAILAIVFLFFVVIRVEVNILITKINTEFNIFELLFGKENEGTDFKAIWSALTLIIAPILMIVVNLLMSKNKKMSSFLSLFLSCLGIFFVCIFPTFAKTAFLGDLKMAESFVTVFMAIGSIVSIVIYSISLLFNGFTVFKLLK